MNYQDVKEDIARFEKAEINVEPSVPLFITKKYSEYYSQSHVKPVNDPVEKVLRYLAACSIPDPDKFPDEEKLINAYRLTFFPRPKAEWLYSANSVEEIKEKDPEDVITVLYYFSDLREVEILERRLH